MITPAQVEKHGLTPDEYQRVLDALGREPTLPELGVVSVMWSEHCSYKSSRVHLRRLPTTGPRVLVGPGENAGVVDIGDGLAVCFKMESHNHPSYIEPYQGAATGVGGILRDVFTMGARPIALLDSLRFGSFAHPKTRALVQGVVAGIAGYGNCMGVPTIGGETRFDPSYDGNCLVNAFCAGLVRADRIFKGTTGEPGNPVFYVGARTGRDGIHGATMASESFGEGSDEKRPTVQVGDPFQEKLLLEACLELMARDVIVGIQDMGAAGLTSSSVEMAGRGGRGLRLDLDRVPTREPAMTPYELLLSESQERMLLVVRPGDEAEVLAVFRKWDLEVAAIGVVTDDGVWRCFWHGHEVCALPVPFLTDAAPVYHRPMAPAPPPPPLPELGALPAIDDATLLLHLMAHPDVCEKRWIWRQYDHQVGTDTVIGPGADAAVLRVKGTRKYLAFATDCNGAHVGLDPEMGAAGQVAECARNLACVGAEPIGLTDCLNFGNPQRPEVMWAFSQAIDGIARACRALGIPVVSGNVSLYNETGSVGVLPTPAVALVGLYEGDPPIVRARFGRAGLRVARLGAPGAGHLGGSLWLRERTGLHAGAPPPVDLPAEVALQALVRALVRARRVEVAHDVADGGLLVALAEMCMPLVPDGLGVGGTFDVADTAGARFGEDHGRVIVAFDPAEEAAIAAACAEAGVPWARLGDTGGDRLVAGALSVPVAALVHAWQEAFPARVGP